MGLKSRSSIFYTTCSSSTSSSLKEAISAFETANVLVLMLALGSKGTILPANANNSFETFSSGINSAKESRSAILAYADKEVHRLSISDK